MSNDAKVGKPGDECMVSLTYKAPCGQTFAVGVPGKIGLDGGVDVEVDNVLGGVHLLQDAVNDHMVLHERHEPALQPVHPTVQ